MEYNKFVEQLGYIIETFGKDKIIFQNEQQFQFELAWQIKSKLGLSVKFEVVSYYDKKEYTDIIVLNEESEFIAIELKYKTDETIVNDISLQRHSAGDLGCFDFWHDVERIEKLIGNKGHSFLKDRKCVGGVAVMISNDRWYWTAERKHSTAQYYNFRLVNREINEKELIWQIAEEKKEAFRKQQPSRYCGITLNRGPYKITWQKYYEDKDNIFKYLLLPIK